jgi:F420-dependent oxidoreductase-like protein
MRIGVFIGDASGARTSVDELLGAAKRAETLGFTTGWVPHIPWSLDGLTALALAGPVTRRIELGTAVMPTYPRHPLAMAQQALSTQAATNGRLALGIGPSHPVVIERMYGLPYEAPARHTREYVEVLRAAFAGTGNVEYHGEFFDFSSMLEVPGASPAPLLVAALAPLMLQLAGEVADGTITYWANERALSEHVVPRITRAAAAASRPDPRVVVGVPVAVCVDRDAARERATHVFAAYNAIPTYQRMMARGGDAAPEDIAVIGTESEVRQRLRAFADAGATDLCAAPLGLDDDRDASYAHTIDVLASMTPAL